MIEFNHKGYIKTDDIPPIIGREDVFDIFNIEFRQKIKKVIFHHIE